MSCQVNQQQPVRSFGVWRQRVTNILHPFAAFATKSLRTRTLPQRGGISALSVGFAPAIPAAWRANSPRAPPLISRESSSNPKAEDDDEDEHEKNENKILLTSCITV